MTASGNTTKRSWAVPMIGRRPEERHRASTPLELLFDLTFVVAVGRVAAELADAIGSGHVGQGIGNYLMLFFAIYWAWVNFTWFASAFDTDDVGYRLLTLVQMAGVLVLAASVGDAFEHQHFGGTVLGYVIMRVALVGQWLRAARADRPHRRTALRYALGVLSIQGVWIGWAVLGLTGGLSLVTFALLALGEMAVPWWAERTGMTTWHPQHIAERYGLFTLIVLGEGVLATSNALQEASSEHAAVLPLVVLGSAGLVLLFGLWWLYFLREAADGLARQGNHLGFRWGYGHYGIFAALAALGAGLEVAAAAVSGQVAAPQLTVSYAVAIPICVFDGLLWYLHRLLPGPDCPSGPGVAVTAVSTLLVAALGAVLPLAVTSALLAVPTIALVAVSVATEHRRAEA